MYVYGRLVSSAFGLFLATTKTNHQLRRQRCYSIPTDTDPTPSIDRTNINNGDSGSNKYDVMMEWLRSIPDATISDKIVIQPSTMLGGGYGAFVNAPVAADELLFAIPRSACITLSDALKDPTCGPLFKTLIDKAGPGGNTVALAGFIAKERLQCTNLLVKEESSTSNSNEATSSSNSRFGPYLATLPWERGVNNQEHILYWTDNEVETQLKGTMCYGEAIDLRKEVALAIKVLDTIIGQPTRTAALFPWQKIDTSPRKPIEGLPEAVKAAFVCLLTRAFQDEIIMDDNNNDSNTPAVSGSSSSGSTSDEEKLVPLLDMLQHSDEPNVSHAMKKKENGRVEVRARHDLAAGTELLNQYRSELEETMPYHRFFTRFGFVPGVQEPIVDLLQDKSSIFFAQKAEV